MDRSCVRELHYITDIANVGSILDRGILSHRLARRRVNAHVTIASAKVQKIRAVVRIPFQLLESHQGDLTVLAVRPHVLDLDGVIIADRNAASIIARFDSVAEGIERLEEAAVFAKWWNDSIDAKQQRMAEVLVPDRVSPELLLHAYVSDRAAAHRLRDLLGERRFAIRVNPSLFFADRSHQ